MLQVHGSMFEYSKMTGKECLWFVSNPTRSNLTSVQSSSSTTIIIDGIYMELQSEKLSVLIEVTDLIFITFAG